jgi:hypothetical protein
LKGSLRKKKEGLKEEEVRPSEAVLGEQSDAYRIHGQPKPMLKVGDEHLTTLPTDPHKPTCVVAYFFAALVGTSSRSLALAENLSGALANPGDFMK